MIYYYRNGFHGFHTGEPTEVLRLKCWQKKKRILSILQCLAYVAFYIHFHVCHLYNTLQGDELVNVKRQSFMISGLMHTMFSKLGGIQCFQNLA